MKKWKCILALLPLAATMLTACRDVPVINVQPDKGDTLKENMINANRYIAKSEETQIDNYVARRQWQMKRLSGGARVMELTAGSGRQIGYEDTVTLRYRVEAINGAVIYDQVEETVVAGHLQPVRGLDAALLTLHYGSRARVILPSEQAYGVVGDGDRIGSRIVLVYELEIVNQSNTKNQH